MLFRSIPSFEAATDGKKVMVEGGKIRVPLHRELQIEISRTGYKTQRFKIPALETNTALSFDVPAEKILTGNIDLDSFPRAEVTFWLNNEKVYSGQTPLKETLPVGRYHVKFKALRSGSESERDVTVEDGKTTVVDHLIPEIRQGPSVAPLLRGH